MNTLRLGFKQDLQGTGACRFAFGRKGLAAIKIEQSDQKLTILGPEKLTPKWCIRQKKFD